MDNCTPYDLTASHMTRQSHVFGILCVTDMLTSLHSENIKMSNHYVSSDEHSWYTPDATIHIQRSWCNASTRETSCFDLRFNKCALARVTEMIAPRMLRHKFFWFFYWTSPIAYNRSPDGVVGCPGHSFCMRFFFLQFLFLTIYYTNCAEWNSTNFRDKMCS